jgi:RNA polymerase primary sigma factor
MGLDERIAIRPQADKPRKRAFLDTSKRRRSLGEEDSLLTRPVHFIHHTSFEVPGAEELILAPEPELAVGEGDTPGGGSADALLSGRPPPLDEHQERHLFRKMNFLFFRAEGLRERASFRGFEAGERQEMRRLVAEAEEVRNRLVKANLGLVVDRAHRFLSHGRELADFISEGNFALVQASRNFNFAHRARFSTYACTALDRTYTKFVGRWLKKAHSNGPAGEDPLAAVVDYRAVGPRRDAWREELREQVPGLLAQLGERERLVVEKRYGLDGAEMPATLKVVGGELDVSVERVRQLEKKALDRLKELAIQQGLEPFAG